MTGAETAAYAHEAGHDDEVFWLQPQGAARPLKRHRNGKVRSRAARATASLGFGALIALSAFGSTIAPQASAHTSGEVALLQAPTNPLQDGPSMVLARAVNAELHRLDDVVARQLAALGPVLPVDDVPYDVPGAPAVGERAAADPNEVLQFGHVRVQRHLVETILRAADATGVDPVYMMALADKESSFRPGARARTSTAEGLFQFLNQTWFEMIRDHGAAHGFAAEAAAVVQADGELTILDGETRQRVLELRRDPYVSALMAGELLKRDRKRIERRIGRMLTRNEFYLSHFFGANAAGKFIALRDDKPKQKAAGAFPQAARANQSLFFARDGKRKRGLTVAEVHERIDQMIEHRASRYATVSEVVVSAFAAVR